MSSELHFFAIHALDGRAAQDELNAHVPSIDHACLKALLARRFKGESVLALLGRIIAGRGLPIGSLTSQHFVNASLDAADRWLLEDRRVCAHLRYMDDTIPQPQAAVFPRAHLRYMDDTLWWCDRCAEARATLGEWSDFLCSEGAAALTRQLPGSPSALASR